MQQDIFVEEIEEAIRKKEVSIEAQPEEPLLRQPVRLRARFDRPELNSSAARDCFVCRWDIKEAAGKNTGATAPKPTPTDGWSLSTFFESADPAPTVSVRFLDPSGRPILGAEDQTPIVLTEAVAVHVDNRRPQAERWVVEVIGLAIVLFIALVGLLTGAREQIDRLDVIPGLVAVFLLGFSADSVKSLFTRNRARCSVRRPRPWYSGGSSAGALAARPPRRAT
jgi:hypothetical protein